MSEEDETVWKVLFSTVAKTSKKEHVIDEVLDVQTFTYNFSKYKKSLQRFDVSADEFLYILRQMQDELDKFGNEEVNKDCIIPSLLSM